MREIERFKLEKFERQQAFMTDNAADFPAATPGGATGQINSDIVAEMRSLAAAQVSGEGSSAQATNDKSDLLDDLRLMLKNMNRAANAFEDDGSPLGTNYFKIEGTNVGGTNINVIQSDLFAVQGKIY